jgi:hypothetical protein
MHNTSDQMQFRLHLDFVDGSNQGGSTDLEVVSPGG